jgi:hypothetical protein
MYRYQVGIIVIAITKFVNIFNKQLKEYQYSEDMSLGQVNFKTCISRL